MKFFRTTTCLAIVAAFSVASALAAMAPRPPAAAAAASSAPSPNGNLCVKDTTRVLRFPLVICIERQATTQNSWGNGFPWENSTFFFSSFRNQYLYPSASVNKIRAVTDSIESIHARSVSFTGANSNIYNSAGSGSFARITSASSDTLTTQFSLNTGATPYGALEAAPGSGASFTIETIAGPNGSLISSCSTCPGDPNPASPLSRDRWAAVGDLTTVTNLLVDSKNNVGGGTGAGVWDTGSGTACEARRAYGSGQFANPNHLTTAYGVDAFDFVWVFQGLAGPPPATVEQQIKEIIRLLLTPEGLRCSGLDLNPDNGKIEDDPIAFPNGAGVDPMQPQVTTGGLRSGDEKVDGKRSTGWNHP